VRLRGLPRAEERVGAMGRPEGTGSPDVEPLLSPDFGGAPPVKFKKSSLRARWLVLLLSSLMLFGNYYCYDNPAALKGQMKDYFDGTQVGGSNWETNFSLLYSVYSFPNTVLPFLGGFMVDKLGVKLMTLIFAGCILVGQCIFAFGTSIKSLPIMLLGRVVFGFGGESVTVATSTLLAIWFQDKELALALGINLGVSRLGGVANNFLSPIFWTENHIALWMGAIICAASFACGVGLASLDKVADAKVKAKNAAYNETAVAAEEQVNILDVFKFKLPFWLLCISCLVIYGTVLPFNNNASTFLQTRDFMKPEYPWKDNYTFVAPVCDGADPEPDDLVMRSCDASDNFYLGPAYGGATFPDWGTAANGTVVPVECAAGYIAINGSTTAVCTASASDASWGGAAYWKVVSGSGCMPATAGAQCNSTAQLPYLHTAAVGGANGSTGCFHSGELACVDKYTVLNATANSTGCAAVCSKSTKYLWTYPESAAANPCVPELFQPREYCTKIEAAEEKANTFMSIPYFVSIVLSPLLGYGVDMLGKRAMLATFASVVLIGVHLTLGITRYAPYLPLSGQGIAYTIFAAALWPSVPYAVKKEYIGTANGVMTSIQNSGLAVFPIIIAAILKPCDGNPPKAASARLHEDQYHYCESTMDNYRYAELFFVGLAGFGTLIGIWLVVDDITYRDSILNRSHMGETEGKPAEADGDDEDEPLLSVQDKAVYE